MSPYATTSTLLTWMIFLPLMGAAVIIALMGLRFLTGLPQKTLDMASRAIALGVTFIDFLLGIDLWVEYAPQPLNGTAQSGAKALQFVHHFVWIKDLNIEYFVGVDGVSVALVILTTLVTFVACVASMPWWIHSDDHHPHFTSKSVPGYFVMFLILEVGMMGAFCALDFFLFYMFWEVMLLPMYFLIGIWGGPRKEYAAIKFFLYTLAGSVLMLLAIIAMYYNSQPHGVMQFLLADGSQAVGNHTFNMMYLVDLGKDGFWENRPAIMGFQFSHVIFIGLFIGFAIKVPMFPFHTWLPDAHVEAPTPISVILAGVLLKMGTYGMLRMNLGMLPQAFEYFAAVIATFGVINIVYAAFVCLAQKDLKKLIAYSSVSHMGFCLLGMAALTPQGISGAMLNNWTHGLISPMLFLIVGVIYDRAHHREIEGFGGLAKQVPEYTAIMGLAFFASLGLPGLCGFISEFLVFNGSWPTFGVATAIAMTSVIITAAYYLWTIQRMFLGQLNPKYAQLEDLNWRERLTLYPLGALVIVFGFYPRLILDLMNSSLFRLLPNFRG